MSFPNSSSRTRKHKLILSGVVVPLVILLVIVLLVVLIPGRKKSPTSEGLEWKGKGTDEYFHEIILGRCYNYIATINSELRDTDCLKIWKLLQNAFMYKDPCSVTEEDYKPLMEFARHPIPCNKSLFWSKTNDLVHRYTKANRDFLTLEDTLLGYIADGISWCGKPSSPGVNYKSCPKWTECENNPSTIYWKMASKMFAEAACGTVQVMLNGSTEADAFRSNSIFGSIEIFNLNPDKVSKVHIWLMHDIDRPQSESCTGHSVAKLKEILESRRISVSCEDNYRPVQLLQCTNNPNHNTCRICS
ncbi:ADP-ribosyl cyclase/cyclic ADP-ribose hydrolase 1 [Pogona vitticeps]|uniref:ADP-ribosyl cyclase/cyclic ADP-ribose hydrolase 1 n=1 Tax=Pogona vitticeps TaxID=103695 RepID=A0A6J0UVL2_9SAUR|nr:ADP-ribosyl cyclase/cyclic ADP-ribose hydrolase 1 [Pogona vitticeps]